MRGRIYVVQTRAWASEVSEEQSKERLRIGREKDRARRIKREGRQKQKTTKQRLATLKRLKRGDENELER